MIPIFLSLSGFLSYAEPVELDFTSFDLACISGQNGAGKSSLLDAITWALFGIARKKDDSIINTPKKTAEVSFQFEHEENMYRIHRSRTEGKTALLEFFIMSEEGWNVLTEATMSRTEERIRHTLRLDYETFTNASFFLQGKADQFAQQSPTERKRILSNILGLEIWEEYKQRAAESRRLNENAQSAEEARLEEIRSELNEEDARRKKLKEQEDNLESASQLRFAKETLITALRKQTAALQEQNKRINMQVEQQQRMESQVNQLTEKIAELQAEENHFVQILDKSKGIEKAYQTWQQTVQNLQVNESLASKFHEQQQQRSGPLIIIEKEKTSLEQQYQRLNEAQNQVNSIVEKLPMFQAELSQLSEKQKTLEKQLSTKTDLETNLHLLQEKQASLSAENTRLKQDMAEIKERIERLNVTTGADCPLCGQPLESKDRLNLLESLQKQGEEMGNQFRSNQAELVSAREEMATTSQTLAAQDKDQEQLRNIQRQMDQQTDKIRQSEETVQDWQKHGEPELLKIHALLTNNTFAMDARATLEEIDNILKEMGYDAKAHELLRASEIQERQVAEEMRELEKARATLQPLQRHLAEIHTQLAAERKALLEHQNKTQAEQQKYQEELAALPDVDQQEQEFAELQEKENTLRMLVGAARQAVNVLKSLEIRKGEVEQHLQEIRLKIGRYRSLEKACGKDGVPALLIEQALPELENQANAILDRLSSGSMSVRFNTQADYKSKQREDKKETLDILIHDSAGTRAYELFSGGEAFRVNFAIRLALAKVLAQRAGARLQTLVIDEGFGSQDTQGKQRLIEAINLVRNDFAKILVITHLEELKDAFPARIEVEKIGLSSTVRVLQ